MKMGHSAIDGIRVPVESYVAGLSQMFPRTNKLRVLESSIEKRFHTTHLPYNAGLGGFASDGYIEFRVPGSPGHLIDLSNLALEIQGHIDNADGTKTKATDHASLIDAAFHTMFKSISIYLNNAQVETCSMQGFRSYLKLLMNLPEHSKSTLLKTMGYTSSKSIPNKIVEASFTGTNALTTVDEKGFNFMSPIMCDIADCDAYLLDSIEIRIRLELASNKFILNTDKSDANQKLVIDHANLSVTKLKCMDSALTALNEEMRTVPVKYLFNKTLMMTQAIAVGQTHVAIENPWHGTLPNSLAFAIVPMKSFHGEAASNSLYFGNHDLRKISLTVNNETLYSVSTMFSQELYASLYFHTINSLGQGRSHQLTHELFKDGRTIAVFNLLPEKLKDSIALDKEGNLRLVLELGTAPTENLVLILLGDSQGVLRVDGNRDVAVDIRA